MSSLTEDPAGLDRQNPEAEIAAQLGIDHQVPDLAHVVNASPKTAPLSDALVARVAGHYRGVYDAVAARFPGLDLGTLWTSSHYL